MTINEGQIYSGKEMRIIKAVYTCGVLHVEIKGHPSIILNKAHSISKLFLGDQPWGFTELIFTPPINWEKGDDKWILEATAKTKLMFGVRA